ncbi:MAG: hypothetical protein LBV69_12120 [Bacteroidales bacterium]|jgi:hypothetical protein|nr:hypothetical protein [Bacteroidales bacterium]
MLNFSEVLEKSDDGRFIVTNKIMYDVSIVNSLIGPDKSKNNIDWFWENLPYPDGENFIKSLLEDVSEHKIPIYYYDLSGDYEVLEEIPANKIDDFLNENLQYTEETIDTIKNKILEEKIKLDYKNVAEIRFLEEWSIKDGEFTKKVVAFSPIFTVYSESKGMKLNFIKFWIRIR